MKTSQTTLEQPKKITMATVKSFVARNRSRLFINVKSSFDGMVDGCTMREDGFVKAIEDKTLSLSPEYHQRTLRVKGAWFVGGSRDYLKPYSDEKFEGISISNSCGYFILAIKK